MAEITDKLAELMKEGFLLRTKLQRKAREIAGYSELGIDSRIGPLVLEMKTLASDLVTIEMEIGAIQQSLSASANKIQKTTGI